MGNKNIIKDFFSKLGWWIYWKLKWQKNNEWKENLSPNNILGKQIRDNLAYFIMHGLEEERNNKIDVSINDLVVEIRKLPGIDILNNDDTITTLLDRSVIIKTITKYNSLINICEK